MWNKKTAAFVVLAFVLLTSHADARDVRQVSLATNDIIYDPVTHKLYASVPGSAGAGIGNTITLIDPLSGAIGPSIFVGSEPGRLALSEDGRFLYVALDGAAAVRRVDMASLTADLQFTLGSDSFFGPHYVEDMEVLPGNPFSVAISRKYLGVSPRHAGVAVYDDGVPRPTATPGHTGSNVIEFSANVSRLYGYNNETTDYGFRRMALAPTGVTIVDSTSNVIEGFNVDIEYHAGRVYSSTGRVIDPEAGTLLGTYSGIGFGALVRPASELGRVFFLADGELLTFDLATFVRLESLTIPAISGTPGSLVRVGGEGLAFRTSGQQVFLIGPSTATRPPSIVLALSGCASCGAGSTFSVDATVANPGTAAIRVEVKTGVRTPAGAEVAASVLTDGHLEVVLPPGSNVTLELLRVTLPAGLSPGTWS